MIGRVVSTKMKNTVAILIERVAMHPLYKKTYVQSQKFLVDDSLGVKLGDIVEVVKVRPISRSKHFKIIKILGKNFAEIAKEHLKERAEEAISEVMPQPEAEEPKVEKKKHIKKKEEKNGSTQK